MNNRVIIIVLSSIIVIQMIAGIFLLKREPGMPPPLPPFGIEDDRGGPGMGMKKHQMPGNRFGRPFCEPGFMKEKLSLSSEQTVKIEALNRKFDAEFTSYLKKIGPERDRLKRLLDDNSTDMNRVREQLKKINDLDIEIHMLRIKQGKEINSILTPEQLDILKNERKMFFEKMDRNRGGMRWMRENSPK